LELYLYNLYTHLYLQGFDNLWSEDFKIES
jgi:hypothetical protein